MKADLLFQEGSAFYEKGDYQQAFNCFMKAAKLGDACSMSQLANMYCAGEGVECNYDESIFWDLQAIEAGHTSSMLNLGITYRIKGDTRKARYWFEKGIDAGDGEAALQLAKLYMISELETERIKHYLIISLQSRNMCESSMEEAELLLKEFTSH